MSVRLHVPATCAKCGHTIPAGARVDRLTLGANPQVQHRNAICPAPVVTPVTAAPAARPTLAPSSRPSLGYTPEPGLGFYGDAERRPSARQDVYGGEEG